MIVVTGATGFVGGHVLGTLQARGLAVRGLDRRTLGPWETSNLRRALAGASAVIHAASVVHRPATPSHVYERFNVEGTRALLEAAREAGVTRFVFLSSIKVHGEAPDRPINEQTPVLRDGGADYARTKALAEDLVLASGALTPIVLRLCPVYGRGDKGNVRTMLRAIHRRRFLLPGNGSTRKSIVHVSTVASVIERALTEPAVGAFVVADRHAPSLRELAGTMARLLGRARPVGIPAPVLRAAAELAGRVARLAGAKTSLSGELIDKAMTSSVCDPSRIERALGLACSVDLEASLADEIEWLRETGDL